MADAIARAEQPPVKAAEREPATAPPGDPGAAPEAPAPQGRPLESALIQRQPATRAAETPAPGKQEESSEAGDEGEIDLDQLARQVYDQLRRRLDVEWERLRRR